MKPKHSAKDASHPHVCSQCGELHSSDQHVKISNRFEELLSAQPIVDLKGGIRTVLKKRTELKTTIRLESEEEVVRGRSRDAKNQSGRRNKKEFAGRRVQDSREASRTFLPSYSCDPSQIVRQSSRVSSRNLFPKSPMPVIRESSSQQTSLKEILKRAASASTLAESQLAYNSIRNPLPKIVFQKGLTGVPKVKIPMKQTITEINEQLQKSIVQPAQSRMERHLNNSPYLSEQDNSSTSRKSITNSHVRDFKSQTPTHQSLPKSKSASDILQGHIQNPQTRPQVFPSMFGPIPLSNPSQYYTNLLPSVPTFLKSEPSTQLRQCSYGDNRCFGFDCGKFALKQPDPYEIKFDSHGHVKQHIYR